MSNVYNGFDADPYAGFDLPKQLPRAIGSVGSNGQQAGESLTLAKKTGVPAPVIDADLPGFKHDLSAKTASRVVQENPVVQAYLDANPLHANVSNDDYENLDKFTTQAKESTSDGIISRLWNATSRGFEQGFGNESEFRKDFKRLYPNTFALWQPFTDTAELAFRLPGGLIGAGAGAGAQTAREVGVSEADAARLERDLNIIGQGVLASSIAGGTGVPGALQAAAKGAAKSPGPVLRPESVEMLKRDEIPPAGFDPVLDGIHEQQAKLDLVNLDKLIETRDQTTTHGRSVDAFEDFATKATDNKYIQIPADAIADLYKAEKKVPSADDGLLGWILDLEAKVKTAQETGGDIDVSLGGYVARVDTSIHTKLQDFLRLREDGVSLAEAKELPKPDTEAEPTVRPSDPIIAEVQAQTEAMHLNPIFADARAARMTEPDFQRYTKKIEAKQTALDERAINAASREIKRRQSAEWKVNEAEVKAEVENDIKYNPTLMADRYFRTGESPNEFVPRGLKLSDTYKRAGLPKEMFEKNGANPDDVGPLFGFNSGEALLNNLDILEGARRGNKETPAEHLKRITEQEVEKRMEAKYGDLAENIRKEAEEAVLGHQQLDILADELRALAEQAGEEFPLTRDELTKMIKDKFDSTPVEGLANSKKLQREVGRAGQKVESNLLKGDIQEAFKWAQRRLLSFGLAREALKFEKEKAAAEKQFREFDENPTVKSVADEYTNQIHQILDGLKWSDISRNRQPPNMSLEDFVKYKTGLGAIMPVADFLYDPTWKKAYSDLTVDEFRALADSIKTIAHNGRMEKQVLVGAKKADFAQTVAEAVNQISDVTPKVADRHPGKLDTAASWIKSVDGALLKMEQMLRWLDKRDKFGVFSQTALRPIEASKHAKDDMLTALGRKLKSIENDKAWMKSLESLLDNEHLMDWQTGEPRNISRRDLIAIMLHMGNESNWGKLTAEFEYNGQSFRWHPDTISDFVKANARKADWDFVQHIWDIHESYWPQIEDLAVKMSGVAPDKIEARTTHTEFGDYRGGYSPVKTDSLWPGMKSDDKGLFRSERYFNAVPPKGYTKARTGAVYPVELDFNNIIETMHQTIHDLAYRESLTNAAKFLENTEVRGAIQRFFGKEYLDQVRPWLEDLAQSKRVDDQALSSINAVARLARERTVTVQMMYRLMTAFKHGAAAGLYSIGEVGLPVIPEMTRLFGTADGRARIGEIYKESGEIRNRLHNSDRDIADALDRTIGESGYRRWLIQNGGIATAALDLGTAIPTYEVAYKNALKAGMSKEDAIYAGESAVRDAHGSTGQPDLAAIMRGNEWVKLSTIAFGTFNHNYGRIRDAGRLAREGVQDLGAKEYAQAYDKFTTAAWRMSWYLVLTALAEEWLAPIPIKEGEHEGFAKWAVKGLGAQLAGTIPWIRDAVRAYMYGRNDPTPTPISQIEATVWGAVGDAYKGRSLDKGVKVQHAIESVGYVLGIPGSGQLGVTSKFLIDLNKGTQKAENPYRFVRGVVSGKSHPEKK